MPRPTLKLCPNRESYAQTALAHGRAFARLPIPNSPRKTSHSVPAARARPRASVLSSPFSDGGSALLVHRSVASRVSCAFPGRSPPVTSRLCSPYLQCKKKGTDHSPKGEKRRENKKRSTGPSRVVPHRSTTPARTCLTSLFGWEAVSQADMAALSEKRNSEYSEGRADM